MQTLRPLPAGLALALAAGIVDAAHHLLVYLLPETMFHLFQSRWPGIDITPLIVEPRDFDPWGILTGLLLLMTLAFVAGVAFAWLYNRLVRL